MPTDSTSFFSEEELHTIQLDLAGVASDLRLLGFNEDTISRWLSKMYSLARRKSVLATIAGLQKLQKEYEESLERDYPYGKSNI